MGTCFSPRRAETTRKTGVFCSSQYVLIFQLLFDPSSFKDCIVMSWSDPDVAKNKGVSFVFQSVKSVTVTSEN